VGAISYWHDSLVDGDDLAPRAALPGDTEVDVAVVGAGFTGLWTARSLLLADPTLRVVVLERGTAGFGASGRNGGWCIGQYSGPPGTIDRRHGRGSFVAISRELHRSVDEVGAVVAEAGIDCGFHKGGAALLCVTDAQLRRLDRLLRAFERRGLGDAHTRLDASEASAVAAVPGVRGGSLTPHAAALHPARLARGLAVEVERLGGTVHEGTAVRTVEDHRLRTDHGTVRAEVVVLATEGYTGSIEGRERDLLPLGNQVVATEPIDDATWAEIGLADRQLFEVPCFLLGYGQRTADGRIVWGGLGAPTWWRGRIPATMRDDGIVARLQEELVRLFPPLAGVRFTHDWGGVMGVPRDLMPGIGYDRDTGFAWAGGYTGQGVATAHAAGAGLADLITGADTDRTRLPWVGHRSRRWEPEPLRSLAVRAVTGAARVADAVDDRRR
jgi:glycine/D-amino acid oxidase-like deaminating enzyme